MTRMFRSPDQDQEVEIPSGGLSHYQMPTQRGCGMTTAVIGLIIIGGAGLK